MNQSARTKSASLGQDTINKGKFAITVSILAVLAFMLFYYRFAGMVACIALVINIVLVVSAMILMRTAFTLPGLAGMVLTVGMSVDANVLIFERIREELERGRRVADGDSQRLFPRDVDYHRLERDHVDYRDRAVRHRH